MFGVLFALIFAGYPVAFCLGGTALMFALLGIQCDFFDWAYLGLFPERVFGIMSNQVLLAVPFFIFMGTLLQRSKLAEDLLHTIGLLFGPVRGGLALAVVFVGCLLAAATGVVGASVVAMGAISLPIMLRYGYSQSLATGVICASGTLGQIVPPSIVLVVLADQLGQSVGDLFKGALLPGLLLTGMFALYVLVIAWLRPGKAPAIPVAERPANLRALALTSLRVMLPPLALILIVLGSIFLGIATPSEAGALGSVGALVLAGLHRRLTRKALAQTMAETMRLTTMVMTLLVGATAFTLVFRGLDGDLHVREMLTDLPGGRVGLLVATNLAVFVLGCFIDFFEIAFILLPLLVPAAEALGIQGQEMVWFGVMIAMNLQTSFLTPPFGFTLFYLRGVAPPEVKTATMYRGVVPFILIQLVALVCVIAFPELVTTLL
ncbi:MAG: TRAP transporter large permease subunit [Planctomycetes bacterium]|mgnify:CR=1 FL=1|nr:TRAP transporter large permease subunit [Planctomycetota bacterium]HRV80700.1 TRAP transporter large permease subunit [Planctomycetota bacterium]